MQLLDDPTKAISILALLFTILSFWWMNWRRGKLHVSIPRSGGIHCPKNGTVMTRLPFSFYNDGPIPIVISNLRLVFVGESVKPLTFSATNKAVEKDLDRLQAMQIVVAGRQANVTVYEFQQHVNGFLLEARDYPTELQGTLGDNQEWKVLLRFRIHIEDEVAKSAVARYVTFDNLGNRLK